MGTAARDVAVRAAMQGGALHYIIKPFDFARFHESLEAYRRLVDRGSGLEAVEQSDVDGMYAAIRATPTPMVPTALNRPTLELVVRYLGQRPDAASAQEVAQGTGVSRGTARRYSRVPGSQGRTTLTGRPTAPNTATDWWTGTTSAAPAPSSRSAPRRVMRPGRGMPRVSTAHRVLASVTRLSQAQPFSSRRMPAWPMRALARPSHAGLGGPNKRANNQPFDRSGGASR